MKWIRCAVAGAWLSAGASKAADVVAPSPLPVYAPPPSPPPVYYAPQPLYGSLPAYVLPAAMAFRGPMWW